MQLDVLFCELCTALCMHLCVWRSLGLYMCVHRCWADHYQTASKVYKVFQHVNCTVLCWWWCFCFFSFTCLHCTLVVYFIFYRKRAICYFMSTWRGLKRSIHYLLSVWMYNWIASITVNEKKKTLLNDNIYLTCVLLLFMSGCCRQVQKDLINGKRTGSYRTGRYNYFIWALKVASLIKKSTLFLSKIHTPMDVSESKLRLASCQGCLACRLELNHHLSRFVGDLLYHLRCSHPFQSGTWRVQQVACLIMSQLWLFPFN